MSQPKKHKVLRLVKLSFDPMENHIENARTRRELGLFVGEASSGPSCADAKVDEFLKKQKPERPYRGWDGQVYPQWFVEEVEAK